MKNYLQHSSVYTGKRNLQDFSSLRGAGSRLQNSRCAGGRFLLIYSHYTAGGAKLLSHIDFRNSFVEYIFMKCSKIIFQLKYLQRTKVLKTLTCTNQFPSPSYRMASIMLAHLKFTAIAYVV